MDEYLLVSITFLSIGLLLFVLGRMRIVDDKYYVPVFLSSFIFIGFYCVKPSREFVIPFLGFSDKINSRVVARVIVSWFVIAQMS